MASTDYFSGLHHGSIHMYQFKIHDFKSFFGEWSQKFMVGYNLQTASPSSSSSSSSVAAATISPCSSRVWLMVGIFTETNAACGPHGDSEVIHSLRICVSNENDVPQRFRLAIWADSRDHSVCHHLRWSYLQPQNNARRSQGHHFNEKGWLRNSKLDVPNHVLHDDGSLNLVLAINTNP
jgi:hypothetical protein